VWQAQDFPSGEMDYDAIEAEMKQYVDDFMPVSLTMDSYNSIGLLKHLSNHARRNFKVTRCWERTPTAAVNWNTAETMKMALSLNLVHAPIHDLAELECLFLRKLPGDKVDHPASGPVTTKDVYDCLSVVISELIGVDVTSYVAEQLSSLNVVTGLPGPASGSALEGVANQFSQFSQERRAANSFGNPARPTSARGRQQPVRRR
jgi:hypothetical protein